MSPRNESAEAGGPKEGRAGRCSGLMPPSPPCCSARRPFVPACLREPGRVWRLLSLDGARARGYVRDGSGVQRLAPNPERGVRA